MVNEEFPVSYGNSPGQRSETMLGGEVKGHLSSQDKFRHRSYPRDQLNPAQAARTSTQPTVNLNGQEGT